MNTPSTELNESLCCIALRYVQKYAVYGYEGFRQMLVDRDTTKFNECLEDVDVSKKSLDQYRKVYVEETTVTKDKKKERVIKVNEPWLKGTYYSAKKIVESLGIQSLSNYKISRPSNSLRNEGYMIKDESTAAIKHWANINSQTVASKQTKWSAGILSSLKSDKVNIGDIFLVSNQSILYKILLNSIKETKNMTVDQYIKSKFKSALTVKRYLRIMNAAWARKEIYSISLKKATVSNDNDGQNSISAKVINFDISNAIAPESSVEEDDFLFFINSLLATAASGNLSTFDRQISDSIKLNPIQFTSNDRLNISYTITLKGFKHNYTMWTNFSAGNSVYFSRSDSASASGEGGVSLSVFQNYVTKIPQLKAFLRHIKQLRIDYFKKACQNAKVNLPAAYLGNSSLKSSKYDTMLYTSNDFLVLANVIMQGGTPVDIIDPVLFKKEIQDDIAEVFYLEHRVVRMGNDSKKKSYIFVRNYFNSSDNALNRIRCLEYFFKTYIDFLSNNTNLMGSYMGRSRAIVQEIKSLNIKAEEELVKRKLDAVLEKHYESFKDRKRFLSSESKFYTKKGEKMSLISIKKIVNQDRELQNMMLEKYKKVASEVKTISDETQRKIDKVDQKFKKGYVLLANAEFGYMFSSHQKTITDLVKKQIILSLYSIASGRGYLVFNSQAIKYDGRSVYYSKDMKGAPFLKIGV